MPGPATPSSTTTTGDAVDLLLSQHRDVERLFARLEAQGPGRQEAFECLVRLLAVHETAEEEVVYPALRSLGDDAGPVADARTAEESEAKHALSELERIGVDGDGFAAKLASFQRSVLHHAESEEREVFPRLRHGLDDQELARMRGALETAERLAPTHPHPHGPNSATGNLLVGPFVAIADRARDALRAGSR